MHQTGSNVEQKSEVLRLAATSRAGVVVSLTMIVLALHRFGGEGWLALSHLVDSGDSELVA